MPCESFRDESIVKAGRARREFQRSSTMPKRQLFPANPWRNGMNELTSAATNALFPVPFEQPSPRSGPPRQRRLLFGTKPEISFAANFKLLALNFELLA
ncbi:MAG: hypothetical protein JWM68_2451 [Verrucomicrobiales bacterium]|nr:hypothetical protein [Verrucomicrobiales bacterium]